MSEKANHNETIQIKIKRNKENLLEDPTAFLGMCAHQLLKLKMKNRCYHCCSDFFFRNIISSYQLHNLIRADFQGVQKASNSHFKNKILRYLRSNHTIYFSCLRFFLVVLIYTQGRTDHLPYHFWSQGRVVLKHTALWLNLWQCTQHSISAHQTIFCRQ